MKKRVSCETTSKKKFDRTEISAWSASGQYEGGLRTPHHDVPKSSYAGIIRIRLRVRASAHLSRPSGSRGPVGLLPGSAPLIFVPPPPAHTMPRAEALVVTPLYYFPQILSRDYPHSIFEKNGKIPKNEGFLPTHGQFSKNLQFQIPSKIPFFRTSKKRT
jgi:hypothetical protein